MTTVGRWLASQPDLDRLDRELLVSRAAGLSRAQILARPERRLAPCAAARLDGWAARRRQGEPLAYILGSREFWGLDLSVTPAVLVPRPDTELLVEAGLELLATSSVATPEVQPPQVLDLGTGSGAVAIAIARERLDVIVTASDISPAALLVAAGNGRRHGLTIRWVAGDWLDAIGGRFNLILSNPPYVADRDPHLPGLAHEPRGALVAGADGLDAIRRIIGTAAGRLHPGGALALEHGATQGAAVRALLGTAGFVAITTRRDLSGLERVSFGRRPEGAR